MSYHDNNKVLGSVDGNWMAHQAQKDIEEETRQCCQGCGVKERVISWRPYRTNLIDGFCEGCLDE